MKKILYKLLKDLPTYHAGDLFELDPADCCLYLINSEGQQSNHWKPRVMAYHANTLKRFPDILGSGEWFERVEEEGDDDDVLPEWFNDEDEDETLTFRGRALQIGMAYGALILRGMRMQALTISGDNIYCEFSTANCSKKEKRLIGPAFQDVFALDGELNDRS